MNAKGLQFKFLYFAEHGTFKMTRIAATSALITVAKISITGSVLITGDATSHIIFSLIIRFPSGHHTAIPFMVTVPTEELPRLPGRSFPSGTS